MNCLFTWVLFTTPLKKRRNKQSNKKKRKLYTHANKIRSKINIIQRKTPFFSFILFKSNQEKIRQLPLEAFPVISVSASCRSKFHFWILHKHWGAVHVETLLDGHNLFDCFPCGNSTIYILPLLLSFCFHGFISKIPHEIIQCFHKNPP